MYSLKISEHLNNSKYGIKNDATLQPLDYNFLPAAKGLKKNERFSAFENKISCSIHTQTSLEIGIKVKEYGLHRDHSLVWRLKLLRDSNLWIYFSE